MLLPQAFQIARSPELFVAADDAQRVVGAAALVPHPCGHDPAGFPFAVRVAHPYRRQGIGRALVGAAADEARRWGALALRFSKPLEAGPELTFLQSVGFKIVRRQFYFEADLTRLYQLFRPVLNAAARKVPQTARIVSLDEAPADQIARFHQRHLGGFVDRLTQRIRGEDEMSFSRDHSRVLLVDQEVKAILLATREDDGIRVDSRIIDPAYRGGWAGVLLLTRAIETAIDGFSGGQGAKVRFNCYDDNRDTLKLVRRTNAEIRKIDCLCALYLENGAVEA